MSNDNAIIKELAGALTSNTVELNNLTRQVAAQADTLNEVKRHSESVKKSVDWKNLGHDVYEGVALATLTKIEETTGASAKIVEQADALGTASREQSNALQDVMRKLETALRTTSAEKAEAARATESLHRAAKELGTTYQSGFVKMALTAALTASLGLFGGYWWAKSTVQKEGFAETGARLRFSNGETYCADMGGTVIQADNNGTYCATWIKRPDEKPDE